jgi:hypothetical protein
MTIIDTQYSSDIEQYSPDLYHSFWKDMGIDKETLEKEMEEVIGLSKEYNQKVETRKNNYETEKQQAKMDFKLKLEKFQTSCTNDTKELLATYMETCQKYQYFWKIEKIVAAAITQHDKLLKRKTEHDETKKIFEEAKSKGVCVSDSVQKHIEEAGETLHKELCACRDEIGELYFILHKHLFSLSKFQELPASLSGLYHKLQVVNTYYQGTQLGLGVDGENICNVQMCPLGRAFERLNCADRCIDRKPPSQEKRIGDVLDTIKQERVNLKLQFPTYNI